MAFAFNKALLSTTGRYLLLIKRSAQPIADEVALTRLLSCLGRSLWNARPCISMCWKITSGTAAVISSYRISVTQKLVQVG